MSLKEFLEHICTLQFPSEARVFLVAMSASEDLFSAITNATSEELFQMIYSASQQNESMREALKMVAAQMDTDFKRELSNVAKTPSNTLHDDTNARKAVLDALSELNAIPVLPANLKS